MPPGDVDPRALLLVVTKPHVSLSAAEIDALATSLRIERWPAGGVIFRAGETCRELVLVASGLVRAYELEAKGRDVNLRFLAAPNLATALTSLITGEPAREWVEAVTPVVGLRARVADLERAPKGDRLLRVLAEQHYVSMERRLRMLQITSAADRYRFYREQLDPAIVAGMPDYHVASYLGVTPETLSRAKRRRS
ncbi:MAG: Crp/Fnr family transcriptional regulator [Sandaracinus sp.]|nr:Crp/Fnr family transcriptional regulator [Sandaracinus sp.]MCB9614980.1 Crp/Fnr family transcriptional regulator [Sandaracinus sp.]